MKDIDYVDIYNKTLIYYLEEIQEEIETNEMIYINHSILYNLVLDLILSKEYKFKLELKEQQKSFVNNNNINIENFL